MFLLFSISEQTISCVFMIRSVIFLSIDRRFFSSSLVVVSAALQVSIMPASSFRKASHSASVSCWDLDHLITALCAVSICLRHLHHSLIFAVCVSWVSSLGISLMSSLVVFSSSAWYSFLVSLLALHLPLITCRTVGVQPQPAAQPSLLCIAYFDCVSLGVSAYRRQSSPHSMPFTHPSPIRSP